MKLEKKLYIAITIFTISAILEFIWKQNNSQILLIASLIVAILALIYSVTLLIYHMIKGWGDAKGNTIAFFSIIAIGSVSRFFILFSNYF